jgi:hypothetical protein
MTLVIDPPNLDFGALRMASTTRLLVTLSNPGSDRLEVTLQSAHPWLVVIPGPYYLGAGQTQTIPVQVNTTSLTCLGVYTGQVELINQTSSQSVPVRLEIVPPFIIDPADPASAVASLEEIRRYCDSNWGAAFYLFQDGRLAACLAFLGETKHLPDLQAACAQLDPNTGLEIFLESIDSKRGQRLPLINMRVVEARLGLGPAASLVNRPSESVTLQVSNPNQRGYLSGQVRPLVEWLQVSQPTFGCAPGRNVLLNLQVDPIRWPRGGRAWLPSVELFEITTFTPSGQRQHQFTQASAPGTLFLAGLIGLVLLLVFLATFLVTLLLTST